MISEYARPWLGYHFYSKAAKFSSISRTPVRSHRPSGMSVLHATLSKLLPASQLGFQAQSDSRPLTGPPVLLSTWLQGLHQPRGQAGWLPGWLAVAGLRPRLWLLWQVAWAHVRIAPPADIRTTCALVAAVPVGEQLHRSRAIEDRGNGSSWTRGGSAGEHVCKVCEHV